MNAIKKKSKHLDIIGWREFTQLPDLKIASIKVKVDTGARTSSLHVTDTKTFYRSGLEYIHFTVHPKQRSNEPAIRARAKVIEHRKVRSSNGYVSLRPVIITKIKIGEHEKMIELTLVNRDLMGFRMLLGREALRGDFLVDTSKSYLLSSESKVRRRT